MKLYKIINPDTTPALLIGMIVGILLSRYVINRKAIDAGMENS